MPGFVVVPNLPMLDQSLSHEIELKLELACESAEALLASDLLQGECDEVALHAVYYDTPDHALRREGLTLRLRREDGETIQAVKAGDGAAGLFSRGEWELPVFGQEPVPDDRSPLPVLLGDRFAELRPLFEVPVSRRRCRLTHDGATIDLAIDCGEAVAGPRRAPFCELELELVDGPSAALFALARKIDAIAPVRIGVLTKAERGYRLLGDAPEAVHADKVKLDPEGDLPSTFATVASACLRQYRLNEAILLEAPTPEAIHQARVALRRLRSAMTLFRDILTGLDSAKLTGRLRKLAGVLGEARDLDVLSTKLEDGAVLERLRAERDTAYAALAAKLATRRTRRLPLELAEWIADGAWRIDPDTARQRAVPLREFAGASLDRLLRKTRKRGRNLAGIDPEARHDLRKDAKKLRYAVEFLAPVFAEEADKKKRKKFAKALQRLQEDLGALNDQQTAEEYTARLGLAGTPEARQLLAGWDIDALLDDATKALDALLERERFWT